TFLSRSWPRLIMRQPPLGDTTSHLAMIQAIRDNGHRIPDPLPRWLPEQRLYYPTFFHWLVSYLSPSALIRYERISGAVIDTLHNALTMLVAYYLFLEQGLELALAGLGAALAGLLFALSPRLIRPRERVFFLNPRPFGSLLVSIGFLGTLWFLWEEAWAALILGMIAFALASITHKFTLQVIVFLAPLLSVLTGSIWFVLALGAGLGLAILLTRGRALRVWRSHIGYSRLYRSHIAPRFPIVRDTAWTILRNLFRALRSGGSWQREAIRLIFNNGIDWLVQLSWLAPVGFLLVVGIRSLESPPEFLHLGAWVLGATLIGLVTAIRPMRFLGQPTRYLEYAALPTSLLLAYAAIALPEWPAMRIVVYAILGFFAAVVILYYAVTFLVQSRIRLDEFAEAVAWLAEQPPQIVLCAPVHGFSSAVWYETKHTIVGWLGQMNDQTSEDWLEDYLLLCPEQHFILPHDLSQILERYGVDLVFCGPGEEHGLDPKAMSYSRGAYAVYRVK
ncbi:MAG TPA: hypothetical protein G4O08_00550, partial [Anaerolineae bacterium]|nr:hypothetical protein [Anaerolineae bacterium]